MERKNKVASKKIVTTAKIPSVFVNRLIVSFFDYQDRAVSADKEAKNLTEATRQMYAAARTAFEKGFLVVALV